MAFGAIAKSLGRVLINAQMSGFGGEAELTRDITLSDGLQSVRPVLTIYARSP
jgi:hypothetical protein